MMKRFFAILALVFLFTGAFINPVSAQTIDQVQRVAQVRSVITDGQKVPANVAAAKPGAIWGTIACVTYRNDVNSNVYTTRYSYDIAAKPGTTIKMFNGNVKLLRRKGSDVVYGRRKLTDMMSPINKFVSGDVVHYADDDSFKWNKEDIYYGKTAGYIEFQIFANVMATKPQWEYLINTVPNSQTLGVDCTLYEEKSEPWFKLPKFQLPKDFWRKLFKEYNPFYYELPTPSWYKL